MLTNSDQYKVMKRFSLLVLLAICCLAPHLSIAQVDPSAPRVVTEYILQPDGSVAQPTASQNNGAANDFGMVKKYAATITANDLRAHLNFIASDELEGRETGTHGQRVAARYLATQFERLGLQPGNNGSWFQEYGLNTSSIESSTVSLTGKDQLEAIKDYIYYNKAALAGGMSGSYVFAGYGIADSKYNNLKGLDLKGKIALIFATEPVVEGKSVISGDETLSEWSKSGTKKLDALRDQGAIGVVTVVKDDVYEKMSSSNWLKHMMTGRSQMLAYKQEEGQKRLPAISIPERLANTIFKKGKTNCEAQRKLLDASPVVAPLNLSKAKLTMTVEGVNETIQASNVLGFIEGTDLKDEVVVLTAHYDHLGVHDGIVFNGADDDGTGTVALLELAEAFAKATQEGHRPRRSILFMPVSGEEKGLLGSEYYSDHPVYPLAQTVCNLNIDMIGRLDDAHANVEEYIYIIGSNMLSSELHAASERANQNTTQIQLDYTFNSPDDPNRFYYRSDHYNFAKHDIPVIFYFSGVHEDYHKSTDTVEKILFDKSAKVTQLVFATAWDAANREKRYVVDRKSEFEEK